MANQRILKIKKGAPEKPPFYQFTSNRNDEKTCIAPGNWYSEKGGHGSYRCSNFGTIKTDRGMICGIHAKVYARRGWINPDLLRKILIELAEAKAAQTKARLSCLRRGKCI